MNLFVNVIFLFERIEFLTTNGWKRLQKHILTHIGLAALWPPPWLIVIFFENQHQIMLLTS